MAGEGETRGGGETGRAKQRQQKVVKHVGALFRALARAHIILMLLGHLDQGYSSLRFDSGRRCNTVELASFPPTNKLEARAFIIFFPFSQFEVRTLGYRNSSSSRLPLYSNSSKLPSFTFPTIISSYISDYLSDPRK